MFAYSQIQSWHSTLKTIWGSGFVDGTTPVHTPANTGHLLHPLLLLPTRAEAAGAKEKAHTWRKRNQLRPDPAKQGQRQPLPGCMSLSTLGGVKLAPGWRATLLAGVKPSKWWIINTSGPCHYLNEVRDCHHTHRRNPTTLGLLFQPLGSCPCPNRVVIATEERGSPSSHLALALDGPSPAPPHTKVVAARTPCGKIRSVLISKPALPPKPLGTFRLYMDTPTQGHIFKTGVSNCFT